jgi:predicted  nucleic acid-binding Zn-ribbon protein
MWFCFPLPSRKRESIRLDPRVKRAPTSTPVVKTPEHELEKESARLEKENRRIKAKADGDAEAKRKLEGEFQQLKELQQAQEKELVDKDATIRQLQKTVSEMRTKVCRVESGMDLQQLT